MTSRVWLPITKLQYGVIVGTPEHELTIEPVFCMLPAWFFYAEYTKRAPYGETVFVMMFVHLRVPFARVMKEVAAPGLENRD